MNRRQFLKSGACIPLLSVLDNGVVFALNTTDDPSNPIALSQMKTGLVLSDRVLAHFLSVGHPESPARYTAIRDQLVKSGLADQCVRIPLRDDVEQWIRLNHSQQHIDAIKALGNTHALVSAVTGGVLSAVDYVYGAQVRRAFCVTRPPGHHALNTGREEGFCFYNHIAVAAHYAQQKHAAKRILIVDWDYHHGNGTEASFYSDPSVLFFSTHDWMAYPLTGDPSKRGEGKGEGYNINVHLPCGADDQVFFDVFDQQLLPAADEFKPDLVLISCGFDSRVDDILGCHHVSDEGYAELTRKVCAIADKYADGRVVSVLEGGYGIAGTATASEAHLRALMDNE